MRALNADLHARSMHVLRLRESIYTLPVRIGAFSQVLGMVTERAGMIAGDVAQ